MEPDRDKANFFSQDPADKVVIHNTITIVNDGDTTGMSGSNWLLCKVATDSIPNTYGQKCLIRARWSIDGGTSWQGMRDKVAYGFTYTHTPSSTVISQVNIDGAISVGSSDDTIYFRTINGRHGNVTDNGTTASYTPTSRTFLIEYWVYEN